LQEGIYVNDRFLHAFASCIGCPVQITVRNGKVYEGILRTTSPKVQVVLERAHAIGQSNDGFSAIPTRDEIINTLIFERNDIVMMVVMEVNLDFAVVDGYNDGTISKCNGVIREKELQPWEGDYSGEVDGLGGIEDAAVDDDHGWDPNEMFHTNAEKFNIKSDYDPSLTQYTTPLHKSDTQEFRDREQKAYRIAMEIERGTDYAKRAALENGDSEEMMFSAVVRPSTNSTTNVSPASGHASPAAGNSGKYVVPQLRNSVPAQRPQQVLTTNSTATHVSQEMNDSNTESQQINGTEAVIPVGTVVTTTGADNESCGSSDNSSVTKPSNNSSITKHSANKTGRVLEGLMEFQSNFKLTEPHYPASSPNVTSMTADVSAGNNLHQSPVANLVQRSLPVQQPVIQQQQPVTVVNQQPQQLVLAQVPQQSAHQLSSIYQQTQQTAVSPLQPPVLEPTEDKSNVADTKEPQEVAKKSSLNPLAKEFNPVAKPMPPRAMPATTPPRPMSVPPPSPVSTYPAQMSGSQVGYTQSQQVPVLVPLQQQQQPQQQHGGPRYPNQQQQKRVTVSARGTGELNPPTQPTVINGTPLMQQSIMQHVAYPPQQLIPFSPAFPGAQYRLLVQQPLLNMTPSHDPNMPQIIGSSSQPGMYLTQYTHNGSQPSQMSSHVSSSQNHSAGPTPSASSGHQTPTPNQHAQYTMQPITMVQQSSAMAQQQHMYHVAMQHQVVGQPQGATPQSPQVAFTSGPIPLYTHQPGGIMAFVPTSQPPQTGQMGQAMSQSGGMPTGAQHQSHLMMAQQTPQHASMHGGMPSQMMVQNQSQSVQATGVGPGHQYMQSHVLPGAGNIPQGHPNMAQQHVMNTGQMYAMQQPAQPYQHGTQ